MTISNLIDTSTNESTIRMMTSISSSSSLPIVVVANDGKDDFHEFTNESKSVLSPPAVLATGLAAVSSDNAELLLNGSMTLSSSSFVVVGVDNNHNGNNVNESNTSFASAVETISTDTAAAAAASTDNESSKSVRPLNMNDQQFPRYVTPKDFELLKVIGMGAFGKVLQVRKRNNNSTADSSTSSTNDIFAMKVISKRLLNKQKAGLYIENIQAERNILTKVIGHPFIINMHCSFQTADKLFIIMDFLAGGELFLRLGREGIFLEKQAAFYLSEIILALDHLHCLGILHRDLKPENILLSADGHICLTDFGLAKDFTTTTTKHSGSGSSSTETNNPNSTDSNNNDTTSTSTDTTNELRALTVCGTHEYMSPEMLARQGYGRASDYWSLGCIAYEMLSGLPPFESKLGAKDLFRKIMSEKVKMPIGITASACKLLKGLLNRNVQNRLGTAKSTMFEIGGVTGLKQHDFFKSPITDYWDKLLRKEIDPPPLSKPTDTSIGTSKNNNKTPQKQDKKGTTPNNNNSNNNNNNPSQVVDDGLEHFHKEFTTMALPRSVVHMSTSQNYNPHRVMSTTFKGFSFVHDDFIIPERNVSEIQNYWFGPTSDDQFSESDCASSKCNGGDNNNNNNNMNENNIVADSIIVSDNKKRPPRNRKKKKDVIKTTNLTPNATGPTPSTTSIADTVSSIGGTDTVSPGSVNGDTLEPPKQLLPGHENKSSFQVTTAEPSLPNPDDTVKHGQDSSSTTNNVNSQSGTIKTPNNNNNNVNKKQQPKNIPPPPPPQPIFSSPSSHTMKAKPKITPKASDDEWQSVGKTPTVPVSTKSTKPNTIVGATTASRQPQNKNNVSVQHKGTSTGTQQRIVVGMAPPHSTAYTNRNMSNIPVTNSRAGAMNNQQNTARNVASLANNTTTTTTTTHQQHHGGVVRQGWNVQGQRWPTLGGSGTVANSNAVRGLATTSASGALRKPQQAVSLQRQQGVGPQGSSDWRMHSMSPVDIPSRKIVTVPLPSNDPIVGTSSSSTSIPVDWPTLRSGNGTGVGTTSSLTVVGSKPTPTSTGSGQPLIGAWTTRKK